MLYALLLFLHTHRHTDTHSHTQPLQKKENFLNTVTVISLKLLNVPCKISSVPRGFLGQEKISVLVHVYIGT